MSRNKKGTTHICDELGIHVYFSEGKAPYKGVLHLDREQRIDSTFLAYPTKKEADKMHDTLTSRRGNDSLTYLHRLHYKDKDEWLIVLESSQSVYSYFVDKMGKWRRISKKLSKYGQRGHWFRYICDDFHYIFRSTAKIWSNLIHETSHTSLYTNCPTKCLWYTSDGRVKVLPNLDGSASSNDVDQLKQFMLQIVTLPFGDTQDYGRFRDNYSLSADLKSFLFFATDSNLAHVSPKFLLGSHPFVMDCSEKFKFIVNLAELLKRNVIHEKDFFNYISGLTIHSLEKWMNKPEVTNDRVLSAVLSFNTSSYSHAGDIIRFCHNVYKHCNDRFKNTGILGFHKSDIEGRLITAFPSLYLGLFNALLGYASMPNQPKHVGDIFRKSFAGDL